MTTPALAMVDPLADPDTVLADYLEYVAALGLSGRSVRARTLIATTFLTSHPDLRDWMPDRQPNGSSNCARGVAAAVSPHRTRRAAAGPQVAAVKNLTGRAGRRTATRKVRRRPPGWP